MNKKALASIVAFTVLGSMAPISANAEDIGPSSVTYTVDLGDGSGGGVVVCPTQSTFTVNPGAAQPTNLGVTAPRSSDNNQQSLWYDEEGNQYNDSGWNNETNSPIYTQDSFNEWERNKKRSFAFTPMVVSFDADGCETSTLAGTVFASRGPVLRAESVGEDFSVAEIRNDESPDQTTGYGTASNVGMANLFANSGTPLGTNISFSAPYWEKPIWKTSDVLTGESSSGNPWPFAEAQSGEFMLQPRVDVFGEKPTGVYKVTYSLYLEVGDIGLDDCWWFCY